LPKLLGKSFFKKKKQPVPVKLTGKDWAAQVRKACEATYLYVTGSSLSIRVARSSQEEKECVENVMAALETAVEKLPGKWKGIKALYMKTVDSVALPLWSAEVEVEEKEAEEKEAEGAAAAVVEKKKVKAKK
jgi:ribosome biogenesis protein UTP30